jgi:hypothetical protein
VAGRSGPYPFNVQSSSSPRTRGPSHSFWSRLGSRIRGNDEDGREGRTSRAIALPPPSPLLREKTAIWHLSLDITNHIGYMPRRFLTEATRNRKARVDTLSFPASNGNAAGADAQRGGGHTPRIADAVSARRGRPDEAALRSPSQPPAGNGRGTSGEGTREPHLMARRVSAARQAGFARALSRLSAGRRKCLPPGQSAGPSRDAADGRTRPLAGVLALTPGAQPPPAPARVP